MSQRKIYTCNCGRPKPRRHAICRQCWEKLPKSVRETLTTTSSNWSHSLRKLSRYDVEEVVNIRKALATTGSPETKALIAREDQEANA